MTHYIKFLFGVLVSILVQTMSAATPTPVVEYLKTGESNLYSSERIDSITFSCYDLDSVAHPVVMTQVIWYDGVPNRTLIADVNNVTLRKPETTLQPNVYEISQELFQATRSVDYDDLVIRLTADCPDDYIPKTGDKIYTLEMTYSVYPMGFMGEVIDIQVEEDGGKVLICDPVDYDEIFVSYFGSFENELYGDNIPANNAAYKLAQTPGIERDNDNQPYRTNLPSFEHSLPLDFVTPMSVAGFDLDYNRELKVKQIPTVTVSNIIYVENGKKLRRLSFDGNLEVTVSERFQGSANYDQKIPLIEPTVPIPIAPMLCAYAEVGLLAGINVQDVEMNFSLTRNFAIKGECMFEGSKLRDLKFDRTNPNDKSNDFNVFVSGKGNVDFGGYLELGIETIAEKFWKKTGNEKFSCGKLDLFFEGGIRCTVDAKYTHEDWNNSEHNTNLYGKLSKPEGVKVGLFGTAGVEASILMFSDSLDKTFEAKPFFESPILPRFTEIELDDTQPYVLSVNAPYHAGLIQPYLGFDAYDITKSTDSPEVADSYPAGIAQSKDAAANGVFEKPDRGIIYRVQPFMQFNGKKILASPYSDYGMPKSDVKTEIIDEYVHYGANNHSGASKSYWVVDITIKDISTNNIQGPLEIELDQDVALQLGIINQEDLSEQPIPIGDLLESQVVDNDLILTARFGLGYKNLKKLDDKFIVILPIKFRITQNSEEVVYNAIISNEYSPSHSIYGVKVDPTCEDVNDFDDFTLDLSYSGTVSGVIVYSLIADMFYDVFVGESPSFDFYNTIYGVSEKDPNNTYPVSEFIRDGNFTRLLHSKLGMGHRHYLSNEIYETEEYDSYYEWWTDSYIYGKFKREWHYAPGITGLTWSGFIFPGSENEPHNNLYELFISVCPTFDWITLNYDYYYCQQYEYEYGQWREFGGGASPIELSGHSVRKSTDLYYLPATK